MRRVRLGRTGVEVSAISVGTWPYSGLAMAGDRQVGWSGHDDAAARAALRRALDHGIDHWDTADVYGDGRSERLLGEVLRSVPRDRVFLASKTGWDPGEFGHFYHPDGIRSRLERSLRHLGTDHLDLYYLHHCDFGPSDEYRDDAVAVLRAAQDAGKIRFLGLSDWDSSKVLRHAPAVDPDVIQPYRNLADDEFVRSGLARWVAENDIGVAFFSPLKHGLLLGKYERPTEFPHGDFRNNVAAFRDPAELARWKRFKTDVEGRFADRPQPVLSAVLGAVLADCPTACALVGLRNPAQVDAVASVGECSLEDANWIRKACAPPAGAKSGG